MLLLSGHSLTVARKVPLEALGISLSERESTANMTPADMTGITVNSWFQDDTDPGKDIVWRVKSIQQIYGTKTTQITLEHAVNTLKDRILFGEITPEKMSGRKGAKNCTAKEAIQYILKQQGDWTLGTCAFNVSNPYKFDGNSLYDALETVSNSLDGCWWSYDFSTYPFKISFTKKSSDIGTIFRAGRNLTAITKTIDRTGMYTRFYPIGKDDLHVSGGGYVEKNTAAYGVISKVETDQTIDTKAELKRWSTERLNRHAEPVVTIEVEGFELSEQTGENMDRLILGRMCYVPLPEFGTEILETITALQYPDKLFKKEVFKATLANTKRDVTKILSEALKSGGKGGRASAKKAKEDMAWFEDTNTHVAMCAKGIVGVDAKGNPNWIRLSQIYVDGNGISQTVETVKNGQDEMKSTIEQHEDDIKQTVEAVGTDGKITAASICVAIEKAGSAARISADHIILTGKTTINDVMTVLNNSVSIKKPMITDNITLRSGKSIKFDGNGVTITDEKAADLIRNLRITQSGNTYTLQKRALGDSDWANVGSFSRAVSSFVVGGGSGKVNVTALPQNQTKSVKISVDGYATILVNGTYTFRALYENDDGDDVPTGATKSVTVNVDPYPNSAVMTRAKAGRTSGGTDLYYGKLYYWDDDDGSYQPASSGSYYWYYSSTNRAGSNTYHY